MLSARLPRLSALPRAIGLILALVLTATLLIVPTTGADAATDPVRRISGQSRVDTSVQLALEGWSEAEDVLLATSRSYPDALAAAVLAASMDAPVLLTEPGTLADSTLAALAELGTQRVTILGGKTAVSTVVAGGIQDQGIEVSRITGDDRFETAAAITGEAFEEETPVVAVALGRRDDDRDAWPDALASAALAGLDTPVPTLLVETDDVPAATADLLAELAPTRILVLGGEVAIAESVVDQLTALTGATVDRVSGETRYDTALSVVERAVGGVKGAGAMDATQAIFVSGEDFPDALGAGALAAHRGVPLLLVPNGILDDSVDGYLRSDGSPFEGGLLVGGSGAVSEFVQSELTAAFNGEARPTPPPPPAPACPANSSPDCQYTYSQPIAKWERLAQCESGGNWAINTGNGYYGGIQFNVNSWRAVGGAGYPNQASKWEQIHRGELLLARQGWGAWPACTRKFGWR